MEDTRQVLTVSTINSYITSIFNAEDMLHDVRVVGEVSGFSVRGENAYFALKDTSGQLACVCFGVERTYIPREGEKVVVRGTVRYYNKRGKMFFDVFKMEPEGQGDIFLKLQLLKEKLASEGLFDQDAKRPIPYIISKVCVLTSISGAVIQDILHTVIGSCPEVSITAVDCRVQGDNAAMTIERNLKIADQKGYDVIIIARGGGSQEDLMPFNDEGLVRAIGEAKTPIVSAVGHETDYTLCDLVADVRALTPTMAGKIIVDAWNRMRYDYKTLNDALRLGLDNKVRELEYIVSIERTQLDAIIKDKYSRLAQNLELIKTKLAVLEPDKLLKMGYIIAEKDEKRLFSSKNISNADIVKLYFGDGSIKVKIEKLEN